MKSLIVLGLLLFTGCATGRELREGYAREPYVDFSGLQRFADYSARTAPEPVTFAPSRPLPTCQTIVTYDRYGVPSYRQSCQ